MVKQHPLEHPPFTLLERGWLSSNSIVLQCHDQVTVVDTGYCTHSEQTVALLRASLNGRAVDRVVNTHLHSDHCGGNAALQAHFSCEVLIPSGDAQAVAQWDVDRLSYAATGQQCPRFEYTGVLQAHDELFMGAARWQVLCAPGHDPHSLIFYCPEHAVLISADALWENGFGVVFPELAGEPAFDEVAATLDMIEGLNVRTVMPGHGAAFSDVSRALHLARSRLNGFAQSPNKHRWYAVKVLCMFWMMAQHSLQGTCHRAQALQQLSSTRYLSRIALSLGGTPEQMVQQALDEMVAKAQLLFDAQRDCYCVA